MDKITNINPADFCPWCKQLVKIIFVRNTKKRGPKIGLRYGCSNNDCIVKPHMKIYGEPKLLLPAAEKEWRKCYDSINKKD